MKYRIVPCFNIYNILDEQGYVVTQCTSLYYARKQVKQLKELIK